MAATVAIGSMLASQPAVATASQSHRTLPPTARAFVPIRRQSRFKLNAVQVDVVSAVDQSSTPSTSAPPLPTLDGGYETVCTFAPYANWLLPGSLMLGRYPFVEPSRCLTREQGEQQLDEIVRAGITAFVCLQEEIPAQHEMKIAGVNGFLPYRAPATLIAAALSDHPSMEEISGLRTPELDKFLPPRRKKSAQPERRRVELEFLHSPITDLGLPTEEQLDSLVAELVGRIQRGESLYVHCWGGRGRAGTVGAAILGSLYGMSADEALARVQRAFDTRRDENRRSPETDEQHAFVRRYIEERAAK